MKKREKARPAVSATPVRDAIRASLRDRPEMLAAFDALSQAQAASLDAMISGMDTVRARLFPEHAACELLGIAWPPASLEVVEAAFRVAAKKAHPEAGGDSPAFQAVASARAYLVDYLRRQQEASRSKQRRRRSK